jgi:hypothetical protein
MIGNSVLYVGGGVPTGEMWHEKSAEMIRSILLECKTRSLLISLRRHISSLLLSEDSDEHLHWKEIMPLLLEVDLVLKGEVSQ